VQVLPFSALLLLWLSFPSSVLANYLSKAEQLSAEGAKFTWAEVESKSLKIILEYQDSEGNWQRTNLGSGFLISPDGLFVTAYHVMKYCLLDQSEVNRFFESVDCSIAQPHVRYKALNGDREFEIQILSHLTEQDSTAGKTVHSPDEIIKQRDFVIGKLKTEAGIRLSYWELPDFEQGIISLSNPRAEFELQPLLPPKRVFIAGYPRDRDLEIAFGYLNLKDENHRGYFAANYTLYARGYLEREGISPDTQWGMRVENHMSGGAVVDAHGSLVGVIVNGSKNTAGVLSIENIIENFFSRIGRRGAAPAITLTPTETPLYLRENPPD
jgi:Trypsin-like peptidase domain